jgi:putative heme iron utilization protein
MSATQPTPFAPEAEAKRLLRIARTGALATLDQGSGAPLTTLVAIAADHDGAPLFLLSTLARHTKNLAADPRASLLLTSPSGRGDPLNRPRLTVSGVIGANSLLVARRRFIARNPKAKLYASFADFSLFRMDISAVHFNGGFARAAALTPADILTDVSDAGALIEAEQTLLEEINARGDKELAGLAALDGGGLARNWRAIGLDPEGLDLASGARAARISFKARGDDPQSWRRALAACGAPEPR